LISPTDPPGQLNAKDALCVLCVLGVLSVVLLPSAEFGATETPRNLDHSVMAA
jgi:hypothetical protein